MAQLDQKILEQRLLLRESVISGPSLSRCAVKLSQIQKQSIKVRSNQSQDIIEHRDQLKKAVDGFSRDVLLFKFETLKAANSLKVMEQQDIEYADMEASISARISEVKDSISNLEEELRREQVVRKHRTFCEQEAAKVNKYPTRSASKRKIDAITASLKADNEALESVTAELAQRQTQFNALFAAFDELQKSNNSTPEDAAMDVEEDDENDQLESSRTERGQEEGNSNEGDEGADENENDDDVDEEEQNGNSDQVPNEETASKEDQDEKDQSEE